MLRATKSITPKDSCSRIKTQQGKLNFVNAIESDLRIRFIDVINFGCHVKSKHDVLSDVNEQKYIFCTSVFLRWYNLSPKKSFAISLQHSGLCMALVSRYLTRFLTF